MLKLNSLHLAKNLHRQPNEHKGIVGKVLLIGGSASMTGSIVLAGLGSLYTGAGWINLMILDECYPSLIPGYPEFMVHNSQTNSPVNTLKDIGADVIVIGPGLGMNEDSKNWLSASIDYHSPLIIDADGINLLAKDRELLDRVSNRFSTTILTPHPGEASRLLNTNSAEIQKNRIGAIQEIIDLTNSIVILKGHKTLLGMKSEAILTCLDGNPGMAIAGMGDVLAGTIASFVCQGLHHHLNPWQASCLAVEIHALAADSLVNNGVGPIGITPSELSKEMRHVLNLNT